LSRVTLLRTNGSDAFRKKINIGKLSSPQFRAILPHDVVIRHLTGRPRQINLNEPGPDNWLIGAGEVAAKAWPDAARVGVQQ
jgi:hypothetical protein